MKAATKAAVGAIVLTLIVDILLRILKPTPVEIPTAFNGIPVISNWIDIVLAVEFGIPVVMEAYSRFLSSPNFELLNTKMNY